jgi:hypothetical protein
MMRAWPKLVALLLSVIFTGAAHACLCLGMDHSANAVAATAPDPADPHACCKTDAPDHVPAAPASSDPCHDCNARNAAPTAVPEKVASAPVLHLAFAAAVTFDSRQLLSLVTRPASAAADDVPIPPLLRDLHHSSVQLTV